MTPLTVGVITQAFTVGGERGKLAGPNYGMSLFDRAWEGVVKGRD